MHRLEVSGEVQPLYGSLGVERLKARQKYKNHRKKSQCSERETKAALAEFKSK